MATASPAQPPNISAAAPANGALELASTPAGMIPITADGAVAVPAPTSKHPFREENPSR
jgi:hypothetical protein